MVTFLKNNQTKSKIPFEKQRREPRNQVLQTAAAITGNEF
jgi:hypothetical protein